MSAWENTAVERAWRAFRWNIGSGIFGVGERITNLGEGVRSAQWDTSRERSWRDGHEFGLEMGLTYPRLAQRIVDEAQRLLEDQRTAKV